ncbi:MAG: SCO family protein [Deltaproteobacteria bacterium]|nr:SCO family protein [Deltaproteobacteria bacterium]
MKNTVCHCEARRAEAIPVIIGIASSLLLLAMTITQTIQAAEPMPAELQGLGVAQKLGLPVSLDLTFTDETGQTVPLKNFFNDKPVILAMAYYECPNLCTFLLNGATDAMKNIGLKMPDDFEFVIVSIDPKETPDLAAKKKASYLKEYGKPGGEEGWHFLTGKEPNIKKLADEIGFEYRYVPEDKQYAHPAALFILTPDGKISRTLGGVAFKSRDLRLALVESSQGKIGTMVDQITLFCYRYDPKTSKYGLFATNLMKGAAAVTILVLGLLVLAGVKKSRGNTKT